MINRKTECSIFYLQDLQLYKIDLGIIIKKQMFCFILIYKFIINNLKLSYIQEICKKLLQKCEKSKI